MSSIGIILVLPIHSNTKKKNTESSLIFLRNDVLILNGKEIKEPTLESGINVEQGITIRPGKFVKKNKRRCLFCFKQNRNQNV